MRFFNRSLFGLFLTVLTAGLLISAVYIFKNAQNERDTRNNRSRGERERSFTVFVLPIEVATIKPELIVFGEIISGRTLELRTSSGGALVQMSENFRKGGTVSKGELLFATDPSSLSADVQLANATVSEAKAELLEARDALILSNDELRASERQFALRIQAAKRQKSLLDRGVGTESALETAELSASNAEISSLGKRQAVANSMARINRAKSGLVRSKINLVEVQRKLSDISVTAKFNGVLNNVTGVLGGLVNANERLGELIDPNALEVSFRISSAQFANLASAKGGIKAVAVNVYFTGLNTLIPAIIERSSAAVGEGMTGREIFARLVGENAAAVRVGDFVTVKLREPELQNVSLIPSTAASSKGEVLVVGDENRLRAVNVKILRKQGNNIIIQSGKLTGLNIVKQRTPQLGEGILIEPKFEGAIKIPIAPKDIILTAVQQKKMLAHIKKGRMPDGVKKRIIDKITSGTIPKSMYDRITERMGP